MPFLRSRPDDPLPITAPLVLNPLMAKMVEAAGFPAGYAELADDFGATLVSKPDWSLVENDMLKTIHIEKLLAVERGTVERGH